MHDVIYEDWSVCLPYHEYLLPVQNIFRTNHNDAVCSITSYTVIQNGTIKITSLTIDSIIMWWYDIIVSIGYGRVGYYPLPIANWG